MKIWSSEVMHYVQAQQAKLHTEAIVVANEDVRRTFAELDAGTKTNVTVYQEDAARITVVAATGPTHASGTDNLTDLNEAKPVSLVAWAVDEGTYGPDIVLTKISAFLDIQRNAGAAPFDGEFFVRVFRIANYGFSLNEGQDAWYLALVADSVRVRATDFTTAAELKDFSFIDAQTGDAVVSPRTIPITHGTKFSPGFVPTLSGRHGMQDAPIAILFHGRVVVVGIFAVPGPSGNTNYAWRTDNAQANPKTTAGSLYHVTGSVRAHHPGAHIAALATGMPRITLTLRSYTANGTLAFEGTPINLTRTPIDRVDFRVHDSVPAGCVGQAYARVGGGDPWIAVNDGQTPGDVGLATSQTYRMKYEFTRNAAQDASPILYALGAVELTVSDFTEIAAWSDCSEEADPLSGKVKMDEAVCSLVFHGIRDYQDRARKLLSENAWTKIELRTHVYHPDLARRYWGLLDLWRLDNAVLDQAAARLTCVSILEQLKGRYPKAAGTEYGYLLKTTASDLTGLGGDFQKVASAGTQATSSVTWTVAAGATEFAYLVTPANVPNLKRWPSGTWLVKVNITTGFSDVKLAARIKRVNAGGTVQETRPKPAYTTGEEIDATTGQKTLTFGVSDWAEGAVTDRLVIELRMRNTGAGDRAVVLETGTINTEVRAPWTQQAAITPVQFSSVHIGTAYQTWLDTIGVPERYRGPKPDHTVWRVSKAVMDVDGQEEAERILMLDGFTLIASMGILKPVNLLAPRGLAVEAFPLEVANIESADMGFSSRLPEFTAPWGYDTTVAGTFAGEFTVRHGAAFTAFGLPRIDAPDNRLPQERAKYILEPGHAAEQARWHVAAFGVGFIGLKFAPSRWCPHLEIGDDVEIETDQIAFLNPITSEAIRGVLWCLARITGKSGSHLMPQFKAFVPGIANLFQTTDTPSARRPYERLRIWIEVNDNPNDPSTVLVRLRTSVHAATLYYALHADGTSAPTRGDLTSFVAYTGTVTVQRNTATDLLFSAYATYQGFAGPVETVRIRPTLVGSIGTLTGMESGTSPNITVTAAAANLASTVRKIRYYMRKHATSWPTSDGTSTGPVDETYFVAERAVAADAGGGLSQAHTGTLYATGDKCKAIAVPIDFDGNSGTRKTLDYTVTGTATATLSAATWTNDTATAGQPRLTDFAWTPSGVADGTHNLLIYANDGGTRTLIKTATSPNTTTSANAVATGHNTETGAPFKTLVYEWELVLDAGGAVVASGRFAPESGDYFAAGDGTTFV